MLISPVGSSLVVCRLRNMSRELITRDTTSLPSLRSPHIAFVPLIWIVEASFFIVWASDWINLVFTVADLVVSSALLALPLAKMIN
jgi:hypothetical protein